ncbi:MAG: hypothetical protein HYS27_16180 [Deltaproteobacteria bacterium]|nr:hypothetical protein [Deltaproteobacteria bacterium]
MPTPGSFSLPPRLPTPGPIVTEAPPGWPSMPAMSPSSFSPPPLPDHVGGAPVELVLETEIDFSLAAPGSFDAPSAGASSWNANLPSSSPSASSSPIANIFDGLDLGAPAPVTNPSGSLTSTRSGPSVEAVPNGGVDVIGAFAAAETSSLPAPPPPPLAVRMIGLAERLRAEGRDDDAATLEEAIARLPPT